MLIYPVTDATRSSQSYIDNGEGFRLTAGGMKWFCDHYLSGSIGSPTDPRVSPLFADAVIEYIPTTFAGLDDSSDWTRNRSERMVERIRMAIPAERVTLPGEPAAV